MNQDISHLIQYCIEDLYSSVRPEYESWQRTESPYPLEDPLGWLYLSTTEDIIKKRMLDAGIEPELFDDIYFAICWEIREQGMAG